MVDKFVIDDQKDDKQTLKELASKVNELVEALTKSQAAQVNLASRRQPKPADHLNFVEAMLKRLITGPVVNLTKADQSEAALGIQTAIAASLKAVIAYKAQLVPQPVTPEVVDES